MQRVFHMVGGEAEGSYSKNSSLQRLILKEVKPHLEKCIEELLGDIGDLPGCIINVADLGCSSGPNALLTAQHIIDSIDKACRKIRNEEPPAVQYFLNDLISNDFNLVFKGLPEFYEKLEKENGRRHGSCLVAAVPGSFYGKLFPDRSIYFMHSSYSLHWLSQVPNGLITDQSGTPRNKGSIYFEKSSPPTVHQAYLDQFTQDFFMFLRMRSQEMVQHGRLLLTFLSKNEEQDEGNHYYLLLVGMALSDMVTEGLVEEEKLNSFNMPAYMASVLETKQIIENEGSFKILGIHTFGARLDAGYDDSIAADNDDQDDAVARARYVASYVRAAQEPVLAAHFGKAAMDSLFQRFENKLVKILQMGQGFTNNLVISLRKE